MEDIEQRPALLKSGISENIIRVNRTPRLIKYTQKISKLEIP